MNYRFIVFFIIICGLIISLSKPGYAKKNKELNRRWRIMVIIPESHLTQPRIPDPAAETMITQKLIDSGFKVIDQDRYRDLRYSAVMDRILQGGPKAVKEAVQIGRRFGADILVTGQAFTQDAVRRTVDTELGTVTRIQCRGRLEMKAIRVDTAEIIYADSIQQTGSPDDTDELASKTCLGEMAESIFPTLLKKLDNLSLGSNQCVELEVRGIRSISLANELENSIQKLKGVLDVAPGDYNAHTYQTEIHITKIALRDFAALLETSPKLKRYKMHVQSASGSSIIVNCK